MLFKFLFIFVITASISALVMTATGESEMKDSSLEHKKSTNKQVIKIMSSGEYLNGRRIGIEQIVKSGSRFTSQNVNTAFEKWLESAERREGDLSLIHFTPDMLNETNKNKFKESIHNINREEIIDKLEALKLVINNSSNIDSSIFYRLINPKFNMFQKSDMAIHWLEYFLNNKQIDINSSKGISLMNRAIQENNFSVVKLLINSGYEIKDNDFESIQVQISEIKEDETGEVDQEKALEAISKIEALLMENIK